MYDKIKEKLIELGYDEWLAGMTAEKIDDCGWQTIRDILNDF